MVIRRMDRHARRIVRVGRTDGVDDEEDQPERQRCGGQDDETDECRPAATDGPTRILCCLSG